MSRSGITVAAFACAAVLGLAGCGGGGGGASGNGTGGGGTATGSVARDASVVKIANSSLGDILVDGNGHTLYLFTDDSKNTNSMNCDASCLKLWPPVEGKPSAGSGADAKLIGTTKGDKPQATYAGHPLYYYANDKAVGDTKGQGIDKIWYVLDSGGKAITKSADTGSGGVSGY